uniref:Alkaline serine protease NJP (Fragments) n=1 Tax=Hediste japonica TaxID=73376 RepID=ASPR_HEDJA|nr:RecName: Full=Alkaline serine protease NJP [Hediste japonica]
VTVVQYRSTNASSGYLNLRVYLLDTGLR